MNFIDTNILFYTYNKDETIKNPIARKILTDCWEKKSGTLSTQVLQEFYVTITTKLSKKLRINEAREIIKDFLSWPVEQVTPKTSLMQQHFKSVLGIHFGIHS